MNAKIIKFQRVGGDPMDDPRATKSEPFDRFKWFNGWTEAGLQTSTVAVLTALFKYMDSEGKAWPSVDTIAGVAGCSRRTAIDHINLAVNAGWIEKHAQKGRPTIYFARISSVQIDAQPVQPLHGGGATIAPPSATIAPPPVQPLHHPVQPLHGGGATISPEQTIEQTNEQRSSSVAGEAEQFESPKPNPNDDDLVRFIFESLADYDINISIGESEKIARRLILSELDKSDRRRYLLDWIPKLREKLDAGDIDKRKAADWLGGAKSIGWWKADVQTARRPSNGTESPDEAWEREQNLQANAYATMDDLLNAGYV